jgi:hypothetical protein
MGIEPDQRVRSVITGQANESRNPPSRAEVLMWEAGRGQLTNYGQSRSNRVREEWPTIRQERPLARSIRPKSELLAKFGRHRLINSETFCNTIGVVSVLLRNRSACRTPSGSSTAPERITIGALGFSLFISVVLIERSAGLMSLTSQTLARLKNACANDSKKVTFPIVDRAFPR